MCGMRDPDLDVARGNNLPRQIVFLGTEFVLGREVHEFLFLLFVITATVSPFFVHKVGISCSLSAESLCTEWNVSYKCIAIMNFGFFKQCYRLAVFAICTSQFALRKQE